MSEQQKIAIVVSDQSDGIRNVLLQAGFVVSAKSYESWQEGYQEYFYVDLVVLDEVNSRGRKYAQEMVEAEEAFRQSGEGPFVIILVSDNDHHLDEQRKHHNLHPRQMVHTHSSSLLALAQEVHAANWKKDLVCSD